MDCLHPIRIKNQYTGKWLHVNCRHCAACLVKSANRKAVELSTTLEHYKYLYLVTLTYDNDNVPYIVDGISNVLRGQSGNVEIIGDIEDTDNPIDFTKLSTLQNHEIAGSVGVLWYHDIQLFFKKFRRYILKNYGPTKFIYFVLGEYGSRYLRPHYHAVIASNGLLPEQCEDACIESWKMHNWNRFFKNGQNQAFKRCDSGTAYYVASYCSGSYNSTGIQQYKQFRQKTWRSKNLAFGLDYEILDDYKNDVVRLADGICAEDGRPAFYFLDTERIDSIGFRLIPKRYISTFFHKYKGYGEMAFGFRVFRAHYIVRHCEECERLNIPKDSYNRNYINKVNYVIHKRKKVHSCTCYRALDHFELKSDDLSFYRAYKRFIKVFGYYSLDDYIILMDKVLTYYESQVIRQQMEQYTSDNHDDYLFELIDTCVSAKEYSRKRAYIYRHLKKDSVYKDKLMFRSLDLTCPPVAKNRISNYVSTYKRRLLPKHLNDVSNFLNPV